MKKTTILLALSFLAVLSSVFATTYEIGDKQLCYTPLMEEGTQECIEENGMALWDICKENTTPTEPVEETQVIKPHHKFIKNLYRNFRYQLGKFKLKH